MAPPPRRAEEILRWIPTRWYYFCHELQRWVGGNSVIYVCTLVNRDEGSKTVRSWVISRHPRTSFFYFQEASSFLIFPVNWDLSRWCRLVRWGVTFV